MPQIRMSAKNLGELKLDKFCERCFWIKLHCENRLPFQIFPGIFSSIDSYTKKITNVYFERPLDSYSKGITDISFEYRLPLQAPILAFINAYRKAITGIHFERHTRLPGWFADFGPLGEPVDVPGYRTFNVHHQQTDILLVGVPDEILRKPDGSYFILDYKTAKFTATQDTLLPLYRVQLNTYAYIGERVGFRPVSGLGLLYYEPQTEVTETNIDSLIRGDGFSMSFCGKSLPIELNIQEIPSLLERARDIYDRAKPPLGREGCRNCELLDILVQTAST